MKIYNKLVRDNIPEIIKSSGKNCEVRILDAEEYILQLNQKLQEELNEYNQNGDISELADLLEVIYSIIDFRKVNRDKFEEFRQKKLEERGGFEKRVFLEQISD